MTAAAPGLTRAGAGVALVVLVGLILAGVGGAGLGGQLGSLFGFRSAGGTRPANAARPLAAQVASELTTVVTGALREAQAPVKQHRSARRRHAVHLPVSQMHRVPAGARPAPPAPAPNPLPVQTPAPPPAPKPVVQGTTEQVREVAKTAPAPAQPVIQPVFDQAVGGVNTFCGLIGGCP